MVLFTSSSKGTMVRLRRLFPTRRSSHAQSASPTTSQVTRPEPRRADHPAWAPEFSCHSQLPKLVLTSPAPRSNAVSAVSQRNRELPEPFSANRLASVPEYRNFVYCSVIWHLLFINQNVLTNQCWSCNSAFGPFHMAMKHGIWFIPVYKSYASFHLSIPFALGNWVSM